MLKFTRIKSGFSENRRLPRLGKIRLGLKKKSTRTGKEFPVETEFFVCPPEVQQVYGEQPTELDIMFPLDDPEQIFVQKLAYYGSSTGLKCHGNGEKAEEYSEKTKTWVERKCPCEKLDSGDCGEQSHLMVLLPRVSMGGCYQITTGSYHSTVAVNSSLDYIRGLAGRIAMLPMKLRRIPQEMSHEGKKRTHYTLSLVLDVNLMQIQEIRSNPSSLLIPAQYQIEGPVEIDEPVETNPKHDPVDVEEDGPGPDEEGIEADALSKMDDAELARVQEELQRRQSAKKAEPKPKPAEPVKPKPSEQPIPEASWKTMMDQVRADGELCNLLQIWKHDHQVTNEYRVLLKAGQDSLLTFMRKSMGSACPLWL